MTDKTFNNGVLVALNGILLCIKKNEQRYAKPEVIIKILKQDIAKILKKGGPNNG